MGCIVPSAHGGCYRQNLDSALMIFMRRAKRASITPMSLRLQINFIIAVLLALFASLLVALQIGNTRSSVREEIEGSSIVAAQLLSRVHWAYEAGGLTGMKEFLTQVGRIRANEVELFDAQGQRIYRSPSTGYKAGREAPAWYANMVAPPIVAQEIQLPQGRMVLRPDPSRATLDGWDDLRPMLFFVLGGFVLGNALVYVLVGRVMRPLRTVVQALNSMQQGNYQTRLPQQPAQEVEHMRLAFNRMAQTVQDGMAARAQAQAANLALAENRELTALIQTRIEQVRGDIARELHDELGQQVTAIKSVGLAIERQTQVQQPGVAQSARLVVDCADQIYDGMHTLIARLRPLALDQFGLKDAVLDLLDECRARHPDVSLSLSVQGDLDGLNEQLRTATYRIVQEALTNALRHAQASQIQVSLQQQAQRLSIEVVDDGEGLSGEVSPNGHFGVIGMRERAQALAGSFQIQNTQPTGVRVTAVLPLEAQP